MCVLILVQPLIAASSAAPVSSCSVSHQPPKACTWSDAPAEAFAAAVLRDACKHAFTQPAPGHGAQRRHDLVHLKGGRGASASDANPLRAAVPSPLLGVQAAGKGRCIAPGSSRCRIRGRSVIRACCSGVGLDRCCAGAGEGADVGQPDGCFCQLLDVAHHAASLALQARCRLQLYASQVLHSTSNAEDRVIQSPGRGCKVVSISRVWDPTVTDLRAQIQLNLKWKHLWKS